MDKISTLFPSIKLENLPPPPSPSQIQSTTNIPPPPFANSINELRSLSTALSTFLNRYDDLNNHLNFIKLSIDAKLPSCLIDDTVNPNQSPFTRLIESFCDRNVNVVTERSPNGTVSDCERSRGCVSETRRSSESKDDGEIDSVNEYDEVDVLKDCDEIDVSKKVSETYNELKDCEEIDVSNKIVESDYDVLKDSEGVDVSEELLETDILKIDEEIDVSNKVIETDTLKIGDETDLSKKVLETNNVLKDYEGIDVSNKILESDCVVLKNSEGFDVSEEFLETDTLKTDEEIDVSKIFGDIDIETDTLKIGEETDVSKKILETDADVLMDSEGFDVSRKLVETELKDSEESDVSDELLEADTDVLLDSEAIDVSKNSEETDVFKKHEEADTLNIDEETDVSKMDEEIDESKKAEEIDISMNHEEVEILMNHDEIDTLNQHEETDLSMDHEEIDSLKNTVEAVVSKQQEETDDVKKYKEVDVSRKPESRNSPKMHVEADISKKHAEFHISKNPLETDMEENEESKKLEETVVSGKPERSHYPKKHIESVVSRKPESPSSPKKHEETDSSKKLEEIDMSKNPVEIGMEKNDVSKKNVETNETKKLEDFDISKKQEIDVSKKQKETDILKPKEIEVKKHEENNKLKKHDETDVLKKCEELDVSKKHEEIDTFKKSVDSELETLCARMGAKGMKKYVTTHITDMNKLREELPKALKLAKDPAKLVLDSIGRFFLQTSKSYKSGRNHHEQVVARLASVMILECFVMISSDGIEISKEDKAYAAEAAFRWKRRMGDEGGVRRMEEVDARGLLLLISGFGIRDSDFKIVDIRDLIMVSNVKEISAALRRSVILIPKVPDVIDMMVKNNMEIEAADTAYTFGLEDKCHPLSIVVIFLRKKVRDIQNGSPSQMLMAMMQQLSDLKSVKQCLEFHKIDPSYHLPDFKINEKIQYLEKEINNWNLTLKRKSTEAEFLENPMHHEAKRACYSHENMPVGHYPMNPYNRPAEPHNSYYDYGRGLAHSYGTRVYGGTVSDQMAHTANVQPYGWHGNPHYDNHTGQPYPMQSQTYDSQPYGRPPAESFPGYPARRARASDLYSFVDKL